MQIKTRQQAYAAGDKYYYTGKPCKRGHLSPRRTDNHGCMQCIREASRRTGDGPVRVVVEVPAQYADLIKQIAKDFKQ